ncbi:MULTISPECIES: low molecular weight protein-tyrosine-phosphatase [Weeksella]|uniref:protein-tyrosine-phosphatase n=1 Tax=Weeksella virosa (strain ATCC 43766 / DSM 16922 / JCM 21250 / CCUG 30538 / CDC 9751 / IAM 14551 / NBRC 16016 / NCTC 11634 / CL345/78) TaxID=865938 RepID=F0P2B9_WEEVC|nr:MULTISPECIES: low molecular weight protein-tyrosine-phosphatase [Weeksella]ADX66731.1 protein tyrosine phosphatase [Weeksella virosa DSM 16922]OFM85408.1 protein-tyrosine-phosphatase [Weeksella sp. HMSC059D05]SUP52973.1 Probable low molecular weight protein-tyrosine-phosphatase [Weeksella virosa]VEH63547.1 Probable low molecular weight protein-tyrosine-phosphatase [Weeksella virosa]
MKIMMVCLGNICRSPLAEGILQHKLGNNYTVESSGTARWHEGKKPDQRSIAVAKKHGIDISQHQAQQFVPIMFSDFDMIFAMDRDNFADLQKLATTQEEKDKIRLILSEAFQEQTDVPDPYYGTERDFDEVYDLLDRATDELVKIINR